MIILPNSWNSGKYVIEDHDLIKKNKASCWLLMPVILANQDTEIRRNVAQRK
jgi:hypothetical protein